MKNLIVNVSSRNLENDMQELYLLKDIEETENYLWCTVDEIKEVIKEQMIKDGKVLAALLKYLSI